MRLSDVAEQEYKMLYGKSRLTIGNRCHYAMISRKYDESAHNKKNRRPAY